MPEFGRALVKRGDCSAGALRRAAEHSETGVRFAVAKHPKLRSRAVFEKLAEDRYLSVRIAVAKHPNAPRDVLRALVNDDSPRVLELVAMRLN